MPVVSAALVFQFTHPGRGATALVAELVNDIAFQFTHPGRGATQGARC